MTSNSKRENRCGDCAYWRTPHCPYFEDVKQGIVLPRDNACSDFYPKPHGKESKKKNVRKTSVSSIQPRKPANKSFPASPLNLYHRVYCRSCPEAEFCKACFEQHLLCLLAKLVDELARIRWLITIQESRIIKSKKET